MKLLINEATRDFVREVISYYELYELKIKARVVDVDDEVIEGLMANALENGEEGDGTWLGHELEMEGRFA